MIALIVAVSKNGVIGNNGYIPWSIPGEQSRFKNLTTGNIVIMGRHTYEEIGHPLPNRYTIVISTTKKFTAVNCKTVVSLQKALATAAVLNTAGKITGNIFIAGGSRVYKEALPLCDKLYITEIDANIVGDRYFPVFNQNFYVRTVEKSVARMRKATDTDANELSYKYVTYTKI